MYSVSADKSSRRMAGSRDFKRLRAALIAAALCVAALAMGAVAVSAIEARRGALSNAQAKAEGLAASLGQHTIHSFHAAHALLRLAAVEYAHRRAHGDGLAGMNAMLTDLTREVPVVRAIAIFDRAGEIIANSQTAPIRPFNAADRAYFQVHRDDPKHGFFVSEPVRGKAIEEWRFVISQRLESEGGAFHGVIVAVLSPQHLAQTYGEQNPLPVLRATLHRSDGVVLARHPYDEREIGGKSETLAGLGLKPGETGRLSRPLPVGERWTVYRAIEGLPLAVAVSYDSEVVLAPWRGSLSGYALKAAVAVAVTFVVMVLLLVMLRHRENAARALATSEARLGDLVASMSDWIWEQDEELRFSYVADHHLRRVGLDARKMIGKRREEIAADPDTEEMCRHKDDLAARRPFRDLLVGRRLDDGRLRGRGPPCGAQLLRGGLSSARVPAAERR